MNQERLAPLIHAQTAAIAGLESSLRRHETIRRILRLLTLEEITVNQAIGILVEAAERSADSEQQDLYQQAIADLRHMQANAR